MKSLRLLCSALVLVLGAASVALACDHDSKSAAAAGCDRHGTAAAAAKAGTCTAQMSAQCTAAMRAACSAHGASAAASQCPMHGASATTAAMAGGQCAAHGAAAAASQCPMHGASATTAAMTGGQCAAHGAAAAASQCAAHGTSATTAAMAGGQGATHGTSATSAAMTGKGGVCSHGATSAAGFHCSSQDALTDHLDCSACEDWTACDNEARAAGAREQVVPLKNGAMIVYTAEGPQGVRALQAVIARHNESLMASLAAGSDARLCRDCKQLRGAYASGKLSREVVNVERGCITLMTSSDQAVVQKIHEMTGAQLAGRIKD